MHRAKTLPLRAEACRTDTVFGWDVAHKILVPNGEPDTPSASQLAGEGKLETDPAWWKGDRAGFTALQRAELGLSGQH